MDGNYRGIFFLNKKKIKYDNPSICHALDFMDIK